MITVNCIGVGHWGPNLVRAFAVQSNSRVSTVCDLSEERLQLVKRSIPTIERITHDAESAIRDTAADAVVIATPTSTHYELTKLALESGKHVLVEKPLARSAAEAEELVELSARVGRLLAVGHVFLFNNGIRGVRNLIRNGELGRIHYAFAARTNLGPFRDDVNAMWDLASHDISILNYWLDEDPLNVSARGGRFLTDSVEDVVVASFGYPNGIMASVHVSWLNPRKVREITVVGDKKMVVWNDMDLNEPIRVYHRGVDIDRAPLYSDTFGTFRMQVRTGDVVIPHIAGAEPLAEQCRHFLACVEGRERLLNDATLGLRVVRALEAVDQSLANGSAQVDVSRGSANKPA